ncbi:MAG: aminodeoxychorismate/anthranilate synthase component II [Clostridiales bacterium]|nr:aminodeoxychorismate/anthranilate synthase component II [Clostridiales bacterium]
MILLMDNYDSFSYNLVQLLGSIEPDIGVVRNDEITVDGIRALGPTHLILSPGPGRPEAAGILEEAVKELAGELPILGVCLGHQGICEAFGGKVGYAKELMHGKQSMIELGESPLFEGLKGPVPAARYHSLAAVEEVLPTELRVIARACADGEIMAVEHRRYPVYGLQFHPESILTPDGEQILRNFLKTGCRARKGE